MVEMNIYYQEYKERIKIDIISGQKWKVILRIPLLAYHNPEINENRRSDDEISREV